MYRGWGNVAYADHILAIHLKDVSGPSLSDSHSQAVVYLRSMRNNQLTDAAASHIGQRISLKIRDWSEVSRQYELIRRSDLDASLRSQPACWGESAP